MRNGKMQQREKIKYNIKKVVSIDTTSYVKTASRLWGGEKGGVDRKTGIMPKGEREIIFTYIPSNGAGWPL